MKTKNLFGFIVTVFALLAILPSVSAVNPFVDIASVEVRGVQNDGQVFGVFAGEVIPVEVSFVGLNDSDSVLDVEEDVRIVARILGEPGFSEVSERFDVVEGSTYTRLLNVALPYDLDDNLNDRFTLEISVESGDNSGDKETVALEIQRTSYEIEVLSVEASSEVNAGENLVLDVVIKNRGSHLSEDTFVVASIPTLGISKRVFLGDLSAVDQDDPERFDSEAGRIFLKIPSDAAAGLYTVEVEAFNDDSSSVATKKVVVLGASEDSKVVSSATSKTFAVGEEKTYTMTIVNAGNNIQVYELVLDATKGLSVDFDESVVAVPAGTSRTVKLTASAAKEGDYDFAVNVHSDGELVSTQNFVASVEGKTSTTTGNTAVLLTVVLAIIFVVLLIVLIVLLTRKPEKTDETGESYY